MMTQAYPSGEELDPLYHHSHRSMSNHYYDRSTPYHHYPYHHRRSHRPEYPGRQSTRTLIHDPEVGGSNAQAPRKRIGVACTRCRKRKIKCTGDVGDGSGCAACKAQGSEGVACTFNRVGSEFIPEYEEYLASNEPSGSQSAAYNLESATSTMQGPTTYPSLSHRQSLPVLQTRASYPESYDSYTASPVEGLPYSSYPIQRNDSLGSTYDNGYRSWSNATMLPPASTTNAYDQSSGYTFGSISPPLYPSQSHQLHYSSTRLPSVTSDTFSPLNMGHIYTSLPMQTVQHRRLPIPQTTNSQELPLYPGPELPEIRPLAEPRTRLSNAHSRLAGPWPSEGAYSETRNGSSNSLAPASSMSLHPMQSTSIVQEPVTGYHYNASEAPPAAHSPSTSPTAGPSSSSSYGGMPAYTNSMTPVSYGEYYGLPPITTAHRSDSSKSRDLNIPHTTSYRYNSSDAMTASSSDHGSDASSAIVPATYASYPTIRHPQPQHAASAEALRRQASFDQQQQHRSYASSRISVSDLNSEPTYTTA